MNVKLITLPSIEPISKEELKLHLRLDSGTLLENLDLSQSIAPGSHGIAADYSLIGAGVDVLGYESIVYLESGTNGDGATVDCKIQESDDDETYVDVTGGAFTQVTTLNHNATQEKAYTGIKQFIRVVSTVAVGACSFGVSIVKNAPTSAEDALLDDIIETAREHVEDITRRALVTQEWEYYLDEFPSGDSFKLPFGNLQATDLTVKYTNSSGTETTMTVTTDYLIEMNDDQCGRIVLPYGGTWPSFTAYPTNPIAIRFQCGYGDAGSDVPEKIKSAIKMICADLFENRGEPVQGQSVIENKMVDRLLASARLWDEF